MSRPDRNKDIDIAVAMALGATNIVSSALVIAADWPESMKQWLIDTHCTTGSLSDVRPGVCYAQIPEFSVLLDDIQYAVASKPYEFRLAFDREIQSAAAQSGRLVCELKAVDWSVCFLAVEHKQTSAQSPPANPPEGRALSIHVTGAFNVKEQ